MTDFMKTDYSENKKTGNYDAIPSGEYEMIIRAVQERATESGAESLQFDLVVRNDLDSVNELGDTNAKYHNRHVFVDNWKRKKTNQYDMNKFQYILDAAGIPEGTKISTIEKFIDLLTGKPVRVFVKNEPNTYNGETKDVNRVAPWNFKATKFESVNHAFKEKAEKEPEIIVKNDDMPF